MNNGESTANIYLVIAKNLMRKNQMININFGQQIQNPVTQICQQHPECKECPLLNGQQMQIEGVSVRCETSMMKEQKRNE